MSRSIKFALLLVAVGVATLLALAFNQRQTSDHPFAAFIPADSPLALLGSTDASQKPFIDLSLRNTNPNDMAPLVALLESDEVGGGSALLTWLLEDYARTAATGGFEGVSRRYGVDLLGPYALYQHGAAPVLRLSLKDPEALHQLLAEAQSETGAELEEQALGEARLYRWTLSAEEALEVGLAVDETSVTLSLLKDGEAESARLRRFAREPVGDALAGSERMGQLYEEHAAADQFAGYFDIHRMVEAIMQPEKNSTGRELAEWFPELHPSVHESVTPACRSDYVGIARSAPLLTFGADELSAQGETVTQTVSGLWHLNNKKVTAGLQKLQGHIPAYARSVDDKIASVAVGLDISQLVPVLTEFWNQFMGLSFECESLQALQEQARQANPAMLAMGTSMVDSARGIGVALYELQANDAVPGGIDGSALVSVSAEKPASLAQMASGFVPGMQGLQVPEDGTPVEVPDPMGLGGNYLAIKGQHLVLYRGEPAREAAEAMAQESLAANGLWSMNFNLFNARELFDTVEPALRQSGNEQCAALYQGLLGFTAVPMQLSYGEQLTDRGWGGTMTAAVRPVTPPDTAQLAGSYRLSQLDNDNCQWQALGTETLAASGEGDYADDAGECATYRSEFEWELVGRLLSQSPQSERERDDCQSEWSDIETSEPFECGVLAEDDSGFYCAVMAVGGMDVELYRYERL